MTEPVTGCPEPRGESSFVDKGKKIGASSLGIRMTLVVEYLPSMIFALVSRFDRNFIKYMYFEMV